MQTSSGEVAVAGSLFPFAVIAAIMSLIATGCGTARLASADEVQRRVIVISHVGREADVRAAAASALRSARYTVHSAEGLEIHASRETRGVYVELLVACSSTQITISPAALTGLSERRYERMMDELETAMRQHLARLREPDAGGTISITAIAASGADATCGRTLDRAACQLGCDRSVIGDCYMSGILAEEVDDFARAIAAYSRGCDLGEPRSCVRLCAIRGGVVYAYASSDAEMEAAGATCRRGCELGYGLGCAFYADWLSVTDPGRVDIDTVMDRACGLGHRRSCTEAQARRVARTLIEQTAAERRACGAPAELRVSFVGRRDGTRDAILHGEASPQSQRCLLDLLTPLLERLPVEALEPFEISLPLR